MYQAFSNWDAMFSGFNRGYGTWVQGEVAGNYSGPFNTNTEVQHVALKVKPLDRSVLERHGRGDLAAASTLTAKWLACSNTSWLLERLSMLHSTSGGSRDTELKLLAVTPTLRPLASAAVTTVTPVAKLPRARGRFAGLR